MRRRLPRWDPRIWQDVEALKVGQPVATHPRSSRPTQPTQRLLKVGLAWARAHAEKDRQTRSDASARKNATPPCRAQQARAVEERTAPALASTALGGVGGPQAAVPHDAAITPQSDAAEDRRRWATPANDERVHKYYHAGSDIKTSLYVFDTLEERRTTYDSTSPKYAVSSTNEVPYLSTNGMRLARLDYEPPNKGEPELVTPAANHSSNLHIFLELPYGLGRVARRACEGCRSAPRSRRGWRESRQARARWPARARMTPSSATHNTRFARRRLPRTAQRLETPPSPSRPARTGSRAVPREDGDGFF